MSVVKVPINGYPYQNIDGVELKEMPERLVDGYVNEAGTYVQRPGLLEFADTGEASEITGEYYWAEKDITVVVSNQNIYKVTSDGVKTDITGDQLTSNNRTIFAEVVDGDNSHHLCMCDGGRIVSWDGAAGVTTLIANGNTPTTVTFIAFIDGYLLANRGDNVFQWSDLNNFDSWDATNFATAETNNDTIDAIIVQQRDVFLFGKHSVEVWYSTGGVEIFARRIGAEIDDGTLAPYTIQKAMGTLLWLNRERRVVALVNRTTKIISTPFDSVFAGLTTVIDARADKMIVDGRGFYIMTFPLEDKTYVYDYQKDGWCEWAYWNNGTSEYNQYRGAFIIYIPEWGKHLVGDRSNGKIYVASPDYFDDDGDTIRFLLRSGHVDHGTFIRKRSNKLRIHVKRGVATVAETNPLLTIRWRDDGGLWSNAAFQDLGLGLIGEDQYYADLLRNGIYRARQYEIVHTDATEFRMMGMEETVDRMTS